jgi:BirA family biotin operon repressor/biotin-[acetyl-CoA-carboxylase] ligase
VSVGRANLKAMELTASQEFASRLEYLPEIGSTNTYLLEHSKNPADWPDFSVVLTDNQTAGRGRLDRVWEAKAGRSLAVSVLFRPSGFGIENFGWLPLAAGLAMQNAVASLIHDADVKLKWPNDVLVNGEKISGILAEVLPDGKGVVIGAGLNLGQTKSELPIPTATSLALHGVTGFQLDDVLVRYLASLKRIYEELTDLAGDVEGSDLKNEMLSVSSTVGSEVLVSLPDGTSFAGKAIGLDSQGRLLIATENPIEIRAVAAADIEHLRQ